MTNVVSFPAPARPVTHRTVQLVNLNGVVFASAGFPTNTPDAGAAWEWIVETVAHELGVAQDSVSCLEPDNDEDSGGDYITVDGLPVYRVDILRSFKN